MIDEALERAHVKISRKAYKTDPLWLERREMSKWEAWEDVIQLAAWASYRRAIGTEIVSLERGEFFGSLSYFSSRWAWTIKRVRSMFIWWIADGRIRAQREAQQGTVYLLINYEKYQGEGHSKGHSKGHDEGTVKAQQGHSEGTKKKQLSNKTDIAGDPESVAFARWWPLYPKRAGGNSRKEAFKAYTRALGKATADELERSVRAYAAFCDADGKLRTSFVMMATTWLNRESWLDDWALPNGNGAKPDPFAHHEFHEAGQ